MFSTGYLLLSFFTDIFIVWQVIVLILGLSVLLDLKKGASALIVLIPMVVMLTMGVTGMSLASGSISLLPLLVMFVCFLVVYAGNVIAAAMVAWRKGGTVWLWLIYAFFLWPIAFVHALIMKPREVEPAQ
jgi:hypothetical protein